MIQPLSISPLALIVVGAYLVNCLVRYIFDPLRDVPDPLLARISRLWSLFAIHKGDFELSNIPLHREYGRIVRIAPQ